MDKLIIKSTQGRWLRIIQTQFKVLDLLVVADPCQFGDQVHKCGMMRLLLVGDVFGSCGAGIAFELCANDGGKDG